MSKAKIYKIEEKYERNNKNDLIGFLVGIVVYAGVLSIASNLFTNFYVSDFTHALIAALILSLLNYTIKPILIYWTLPLTIITYGIAYPIVNMIILKVCDLIMGSCFSIHGFISMFFISIFISALRIFLDRMITNRFGGR